MANRLGNIGKLVTNNWELKVFALVLAVISYHAIREATSFKAPSGAPFSWF